MEGSDDNCRSEKEWQGDRMGARNLKVISEKNTVSERGRVKGICGQDYMYT